MFNSALAKKYIRESFLLWIALAIGLFSFAWFRVWIVGEVDTARFEQILELLPKDWRRFSPVNFEWLISYLGRTSLTLDEPMIMMMTGIWAIVRGSDVVSGELNRGTMELVLSQPISRRQVYLQHGFLTVAGLMALIGLIWLAMSIAVWTTDIEQTTYPVFKIPLVNMEIPITVFGATEELVPMIEKVQPIQFGPGVVNLFFFGFFMVGFSMMFSSWDRFRWRTLGIVVGIYFVQAMLKVGAVASEQFSWLKYLTYFSLYEPALSVEFCDTNPEKLWHLFRYTENGGFYWFAPLGFNLVLMLMGLLCFWVGVRVFHRRDLPAPV